MQVRDLPKDCAKSGDLAQKSLKTLADRLKEKGLEVTYQEHSWGKVAKFKDPDGNLCAFKDSASFEKQFEEYQEGLEHK